MVSSGEARVWSVSDSSSWIRVPGSHDDKYSHGVLGVNTGSRAYPGAAVLGVEGAARTGIGLIRFSGPEQATSLILARRPEVVTVPGEVDAFLLGSGWNAQELAQDSVRSEEIAAALVSGSPLVLDAGALDLVVRASGATVITPHARELARMFASRGQTDALSGILSNPGYWSQKAAAEFSVTVILKGSDTFISAPAIGRNAAFHAVVSGTTPWLSTAGTGDVLAGVAASLLATHADLIQRDAGAVAPLAATAVFLHAEAARLASSGGPIVALDVAQSLPRAIAQSLNDQS